MSSMSTADAYNAGFVTGEYIERERIIALLEAELVNLYEPDRDRLIALIKGENNP